MGLITIKMPLTIRVQKQDQPNRDDILATTPQKIASLFEDLAELERI